MEGQCRWLRPGDGRYGGHAPILEMEHLRLSASHGGQRTVVRGRPAHSRSAVIGSAIGLDATVVKLADGFTGIRVDVRCSRHRESLHQGGLVAALAAELGSGP